MQNQNSMKNGKGLPSQLESRGSLGQRIGRGIVDSCLVLFGTFVAICTILFVLLAVIVLMPRNPWPDIQDKEALVQECAEWMEAWKEAEEKGESRPSKPPRIAGISCASSEFGATCVEDEHVAIFVEMEADSFYVRYTTYFYVVFPLELDNPDYRPSPSFPCKATKHPRIFKRKRKDFFDLTD